MPRSSKDGNSSRNSSIEILRIVAMLCIVLSHAVTQGGYNLAVMDFSVNRVFLNIAVLGNLGVDIYVIISGYFLCEKDFSWRSIYKLLGQVWFYSILIFAICSLGLGYRYSFGELLKVFLPTIFAEYWFFSVYIVLVFLSPYLNIFIRNASKKQFMSALLTMLCFWVVVPTFTTQNMYAGRVAEFVLFYFIGSYFRKYPNSILNNKKYYIGLSVGSYLLLVLSTVVIGIAERWITALAGKGSALYDRHSILIVACAIGLVAMAVFSKPFTNQTINKIAGCTFGVYLIHSNPIINKFLWLEWFSNYKYAEDVFLIARILTSVIIVFAVSAIMEYLRQVTVGKAIEHLVELI